MNKNLVDLFRQTINNKLRLDRQDRDWFLGETPSLPIRPPSRNSLGFSLDGDALPRSTLFNSQPPSHITKMCDAIIVLSYKNKDYIFVIEQKTKHSNYYKKQLTNGKHFCDWILALLKEHGYYNREVVFIGLLCYFPRKKSQHKGATRHGNRIKSENIPPLQKFFKVENQTHIYLLNYLKKFLNCE